MGMSAREPTPCSAGKLLAAERGQALIAAVVMTAVMAMVVAGLVTAATMRLSRARLFADRLSARQAADSGVDLALGRLGQLWAQWAWDPNGNPDNQLKSLQPSLAHLYLPGAGPAAQQVVADVYAPGPGGADRYSYSVTAHAQSPGQGTGYTVRALADTPFRYLLYAQRDIRLAQNGLQLLAIYVRGHVRAENSITASFNGIPVAFPQPSGTDVHGQTHQVYAGQGVPRQAFPPAGAFYEALASRLSGSPATLRVNCQATPSSCTGAVTVTQDTYFAGDVTATSFVVGAPGASVVIDGNLAVTGQVAIPEGTTVYVRGNLSLTASDYLIDMPGTVAVGGRTDVLQTQTCVLFLLGKCLQWDTVYAKVKAARVYAVSVGPTDNDNSINISGATLELLGGTAARLFLFTEPCPGCNADINFQNPRLAAASVSQCNCSFVSGRDIAITFSGISLASAVTFQYDPRMWRALPGSLDPARAFRVLRWKGERQ